MHRKLTPPYLYCLVNRPINDRYQIRNIDEQYIHPVTASKTIYFDSFLPSTIRLWNNLSLTTRECPTISAFKQLLNNTTKQKPFYNTGTRKGQVLHARLRMSCSNLNSDLVSRYLSEDRACACGNPNENAEHYLLHCQNFTHARRHIQNLGIPVDAHTLLYGSEDLPDKENSQIFIAVQNFIIETARF